MANVVATCAAAVLLQLQIDVVEGGRAVDVGLALAEQVQVGTVENKNGGHKAGNLCQRAIPEQCRQSSAVVYDFVIFQELAADGR